MRHKLFHVAAAMSLLMLVSLTALTIRSNWVAEAFEWTGWTSSDGSWHMISFISHGGELVYTRVIGQSVPGSAMSQSSDWTYRRIRLPSPSRWYWPDLSIHSGQTPGPNPMKWENWYISVPDWMLIAAASVLPAIWWARWRDASLRRRGLCPKCGYDLRATPGRCPECGYTPPIHAA